MLTFFKALIFTFLVSLASISFAHDLNDQVHDTVKNIADMGYTSNKKFTFSRAAVDSVLHDDFDATQGINDNTKRAKAYLKGTVDETVNLFAGGDLPTKKGVFLAALDRAIANKGSPIEVNLDTIGFNVAKVATGGQIADSAQLFFEAISPYDLLEKSISEKFMNSVFGLYEDGVLSGLTSLDLEDRGEKAISKILENLSLIGVRMSEMEGRVALLEKNEVKNPQDIIEYKSAKIKNNIPEERKESTVPSNTNPVQDPFYTMFPELNPLNYKDIITPNYSRILKYKTWKRGQALAFSMGAVGKEVIRKPRKEYNIRKSLYNNHRLDKYGIKPQDFYKWACEMEFLMPIEFHMLFHNR